VERYIYDAYGGVAIYDASWLNARGTSSYDNAVLYTGREHDGETGLCHYRKRCYCAEIGRFMSRDPLPNSDADHAYAYVRNQPLTRLDPTGAIAIDFNQDDVTYCKDMLTKAAKFPGVHDVLPCAASLLRIFLGIDPKPEDGLACPDSCREKLSGDAKWILETKDYLVGNNIGQCNKTGPIRDTAGKRLEGTYDVLLGPDLALGIHHFYYKRTATGTYSCGPKCNIEPWKLWFGQYFCRCTAEVTISVNVNDKYDFEFNPKTDKVRGLVWCAQVLQDAKVGVKFTTNCDLTITETFDWVHWG